MALPSKPSPTKVRKEHRHQQESIDEWIDTNADGADIDRYVDLGQFGADDTREQFGQLLDAIETGTYDYVVC